MNNCLSSDSENVVHDPQRERQGNCILVCVMRQFAGKFIIALESILSMNVMCETVFLFVQHEMG